MDTPPPPPSTANIVFVCVSVCYIMFIHPHGRFPTHFIRSDLINCVCTSPPRGRVIQFHSISCVPRRVREVRALAPALAPCVLERVCDSWQPRASVPPLLLLLLILLTCSGSRGSRKSRFRCLICQTIGEKLKGGRLQWHDWDDECSFDRS